MVNSRSCAQAVLEPVAGAAELDSNYKEAQDTESTSVLGASLVVQWLRYPPCNVEDVGSIPGSGTKIPYAVGF